MELIEHFLYQDYYQAERRVRVWLPETYHDTQQPSFGVLYLHDGQNVFIDEEAYVGHSWRVVEAMTLFPKEQQVIIVGIDNHPEKRLDEYSPWDVDSSQQHRIEKIGGDGQAYAEWVVEVVKPFIDQQYHTKTDATNTFLAGSSMGGLMTAYMGAKYPEVFGNLGVFSLASWFNEGAFLDYINTHPIKPTTKVYLQVGTEETDALAEPTLTLQRNQQYVDCTLNYFNALLTQGVPNHQMWLRILVGEHHHEQYWAQHFGEYLTFMLAK